MHAAKAANVGTKVSTAGGARSAAQNLRQSVSTAVCLVPTLSGGRLSKQRLENGMFRPVSLPEIFTRHARRNLRIR